MITYYKKLYIKTVDNLCEAIHCSLSEILAMQNSLSVYFDAPSLQIIIIIRFVGGLTININIEHEEYEDFLDILDLKCASEWDYNQFIGIIKNKIKSLILENYIK